MSSSGIMLIPSFMKIGQSLSLPVQEKRLDKEGRRENLFVNLFKMGLG